MAKSVRVNLSLPPEMAAVVAEVAEATGRSAAGVVMEALAWRLPYFRTWLKEAQASVMSSPQAGGVPARGEAPRPAVETRSRVEAPLAQKLSPAQRLMAKQQERMRERQQQKSDPRK